MVITIFFGGILLGFLAGYIFMALLSAASYQNRCEQLAEALAYHQLAGQQQPGAKYLSPDWQE
jgi:fructose-specific phosphotransferase system IIC component